MVEVGNFKFKNMKVKAINKNTNQQFDCEEIKIKGYKYYISNEQPLNGEPYYVDNSLGKRIETAETKPSGIIKRIICSNNPNIDIPKVVDDYKNASWWAADLYGYDKNCELPTNDVEVNSFIEGYNKSQETHSNSDEDMVDFYEWCDTSEEATIFWKRNKVDPDMSGNHWKKIRENREKLLQLWKEQKSKIIYYNG